MHLTNSRLTAVLILVCVISLASCSKVPAPQQDQKAPPSSETQRPSTAPPPQSQAPQQAPASQPQQAPAATPAVPPGALATEKYRLNVVDYAKTPVTVSVNGQWVGQWDSHTDVPLESVVSGKNQLTVELQGTPDNQLTVTVYTNRAGQNVNLLSLNFQGKTGTQNFTFVAK